MNKDTIKKMEWIASFIEYSMAAFLVLVGLIFFPEITILLILMSLTLAYYLVVFTRVCLAKKRGA